MIRYFSRLLQIRLISIHSFLFLFVVFLFTLNIQAGTTGKISGVVLEESTGQPLPGANITILNTQWGASSNIDGKYDIINIPPGTYTLVVQFIGFAKYTTTNVKVSIDRTTVVDVSLSVETVMGQEVVVQAERPVIEKDRTQTTAVVNTETIDLMPVTSVAEVVALQAGVVDAGGLHFRGGRSREVSYVIDGIPVNNSYSQEGGGNVQVENEMVEELEVISGTFNAEYGQAQSGVINIITKAPAQNISGSVYAFSGDWLSSHDDVYMGINNFDPLNEKDIRFSLSGPLFSKKLGFFVTGRYNDWKSIHWYDRRFNPYDGWRISAYENWFQKYNTEAVAESQAIFIPDSLRTGDNSSSYLASGFGTNFSAKLSYFASSTFSLTYQAFGSYNYGEGSSDRTYRYQPDERGQSESWGLTQNFSLHHMPTNNFFYDLAFSYQYNTGEGYYRKDNKQAIVPGEEGIQLITASASGFSLGSTGWFYSGKEGKNYRKQYQLNGSINWQIDDINFLKVGFLAISHDINTYSWGYRATQEWNNNAFPSDYQVLDSETGDFREPTYAEYWDYLENDYWENWREMYGTEPYIAVPDSETANWRDYNIKPFEGALYIQDKIELGEIIINAGLRFDIFKSNEKYPIELRTEAGNLGDESNLAEASIKYKLSPRLGISFPISDNGAFHASYGHFFQMPSFSSIFNEPLKVITPLNLRGRRLGNADIDPEITISYEIGLQQGITESIALDITAYYKDFRNLLGIEQITTIDAIGYTRYINRDYGSNKGITFSLSTARAGLVSGGINYTLAFANGSASDPSQLQLLQTASRIGADAEAFMDRKILPLNWDQWHTANMYINISQPRDWSVGLVGSYTSGTPYSPTFVDRYDIMESEYRNAAYKPERIYLDMKAKKFFSLGAGIDMAVFLLIDNIFDHLNHVGVYSSTGRADEIARLPENEELLIEQLQQQGLFTLQEVDHRVGYFSSPRKLRLGIEIHF